jgi:SAM-dependent methyltransferase
VEPRLDYVQINAAAWDARHEDQMEAGQRGWADAEPSWGIFHVPERTVRLLPGDLDGTLALELGCGTAYVSAWLARRGARPVGLDPSTGQLGISRRLQDQFGLHFPLIRASGEHLIISEYGAAIWADPVLWIPEASRLLRPGGRLVFLGNSTLLMLCVPDQNNAAATDRLVRPYFDMHRFEWPDDATVEFHLGHGDWIRLLRANRFEIEDLVELCPPAGSQSTYSFVGAEWAQKWPCEEAWCARRV